MGESAVHARSLVIAAALALSGCAGNPFGSDSSLPGCADVWVDGEQLPDDYDGCRLDGQTVEPEVFECVTRADDELVIYRDESKPPRIWTALRGKEIREATAGATFLVC